MPGSITNKPKILHGAFVEYGLSIPPLAVVFQFNPEQLTRNRSLSFGVPSGSEEYNIRRYHKSQEDLEIIQIMQTVEVEEETINFEIRLDATDRLNDGDTVAGLHGIAPQLATLELMMLPKEESLIGKAVEKLLGSEGGFSFTKKPNPPLVLFIWGTKRVLPVNINSLNITETEFSTNLDPIRATVAVNLTVIEGMNPPFAFSKVALEERSALNQADVAGVTDVLIPG